MKKNKKINGHFLEEILKPHTKKSSQRSQVKAAVKK